MKKIGCKWFSGLLFLLILFSGTASAAKIYKWTDENGQVHFSTQPPPEVMNITKELSISTGKDESVTVDSIIQSRWYANQKSKAIELALYSSHYRWVVSTAGGGQSVETGAWEAQPRKIKFYTKDKTLRKAFAFRDAKRNSFVLVDLETEQPITFHRLDDRPRELNEREQLLSGEWAEVSRTGRLLGKAFFGEGIFRQYDVNRYEKKFGSPNPNYVVAEGNWELLGDNLTLNYVSAAKRLLKKTATSETWAVEQLDYRNLVLRSMDSNETLQFTRKRTK